MFRVPPQVPQIAVYDPNGRQVPPNGPQPQVANQNMYRPRGAARNAPLAPLPPNTGANFDFVPLGPRRYTYAGIPSRIDVERRQRINWNMVRPLRDRATNARVYRFNDAHCHMHDYTGAGHRIADVIAKMIELGIPRSTLIPIPTTLVSVLDDQRTYALYGDASHCGDNYYVPEEWVGYPLDVKMLEAIKKKVRLRVNNAVDDNLMRQVADAVISGEIEPYHLDRLDLALTGIHLGDRRVCKQIIETLWRMKGVSDELEREMINQGKGMDGQRLRFTHIGEVTLKKELVQELFEGDTQANLHDNIAATRDAMRLAGITGMPWILHCDVDKAEGLKSRKEKGKRPTNIEGIKTLMRSCPHTEIIWAHAGGLGRFVKESKRHLEELTELMEDSSLRHVKLDISWSTVAEQLDRDPDARRKWARFLAKYSDRIMFGSDALTPKTERKWTETFDIYNQRLFQLIEARKPGSVQKILFENYFNTFVRARERVDCFMDYVLPEIIQGVQNVTGPENLDLSHIRQARDDLYRHHAPNDHRIRRVTEYFQERERRPLPDPEPTKDRKYQLLKGALNKITGGKANKNYKFESNRSGDICANRRRRQEYGVLSERFDELNVALNAMPIRKRFDTQTILWQVQDVQKAIEDRLDTDVPPDLQLTRMRDLLNDLITNIQAYYPGYVPPITPLPPAVAGTAPPPAPGDLWYPPVPTVQPTRLPGRMPVTPRPLPAGLLPAGGPGGGPRPHRPLPAPPRPRRPLPPPPGPPVLPPRPGYVARGPYAGIGAPFGPPPPPVPQPPPAPPVVPPPQGLQPPGAPVPGPRQLANRRPTGLPGAIVGGPPLGAPAGAPEGAPEGAPPPAVPPRPGAPGAAPPYVPPRPGAGGRGGGGG